MAKRHSRVGKAKDRVSFWRSKIRETWNAACEIEGINPAERFIVFRDDNPHLPAHEQAMSEFLNAQRVAAVVEARYGKQQGGGYR